MSSKNIIDIFKKYFNIYNLNVDDFIKIVLYYSRSRCLNMLKLVLISYEYSNKLNIKFESPPLISTQLFRTMRRLSDSGVVYMDGNGSVCLSESSVRDVLNLIEAIRKCEYVVIGCICMKYRDFISDLLRKLSYFENTENINLLKRYLEDVIINDLHSPDILHIARQVLRCLN